MFIKEIILENFMSYEYARIPFKPGLNVICGPNGSGKSSTLLGISVALGQSYTERSKKLSDLIRWDKDQARVTLVLDNSRKSNRRPVPRINKDYIILTRILRRDGTYWFELDNKAATKIGVIRLLSKLGIDPENMLIIMHQNMVEEFTVLSSQEKLKMVEAAVGLESFRKNVSKAQRKLTRILSQEESVEKLLESAEQTLNYWREQYDRYQQKKQLQIKRRFLERELTWAEVAKREKAVAEIKEKIQRKQNEIRQIEKETEITDKQTNELQTSLQQKKNQWRTILEERLTLERERAKHEASNLIANQTLEESNSWIQTHLANMNDCLNKIEQLETVLHDNQNPTDISTHLAEIKRAYKNLDGTWTNRFNAKREQLKNSLETFHEQLTKLDTQVTEIKMTIDNLNSEIEKSYSMLIDKKISLALLDYRKENLQQDLGKLDKDHRNALLDLSETRNTAEETGPQIAVVKSIMEILDEIRVTDGHLAALADVSEDIERMYESYSKLYLELKEKARVVAENREKALEEVKTRMETWRTVMKNLLDHANFSYQEILSIARAVGEVGLTNEHDIEEAGLEILVGFKGAKPVPLNSYTQSGGERSTATMAFLLALQQHVRSPFRAVDEYDTHMDPRNREMIANLLVSSVKGSDAQYLAITPSQVTFEGDDVHIITVQNIEGTSAIREVT